MMMPAKHDDAARHDDASYTCSYESYSVEANDFPSLIITICDVWRTIFKPMTCVQIIKLDGERKIKVPL
jgi:hypothetical protein